MAEIGKQHPWSQTNRPWPKFSQIEEVVRDAVGSSYRLATASQLGGRSLLLKGQLNSKAIDLVALRQRSSDVREVLPLREEAQLLSFLSSRVPSLSLEPVHFYDCSDNDDEPLLFVPWLKGSRLGDRLKPGGEWLEIWQNLNEMLQRLHCIGNQPSRPDLSRIISVQRLIARTEQWDTTKLPIKTQSDWKGCLTRMSQALAEDMSFTVLHGDPHAYNVLCIAGESCWLDFECAALGPPEIDHARMLVLLSYQSRKSFTLTRSPRQSACDVLIGGEWLQSPPANATEEAVEQVRCVVSQAYRHLEHAYD